MSALAVLGHVRGKGTATPKPAQLRAIMPLPADLQVLDCLVAQRLNTWIDENIAVPQCCWVGARPFTQALDITHALHLLIERGLDDHSQSAVAQSDIEACYDSLPV
eukprot:7736181-Pyramimonas_sp.AAC.1